MQTDVRSTFLLCTLYGPVWNTIWVEDWRCGLSSNRDWSLEPVILFSNTKGNDFWFWIVSCSWYFVQKWSPTKNGSFVRLRSSDLFGSSVVNHVHRSVQKKESHMKYIMSKVFLGKSERNTAYSQNVARGTEKKNKLESPNVLAMRFARRNCRGLFTFSGKSIVYLFFLPCLLKSRLILSRPWCTNHLKHLLASNESWSRFMTA